MTPQVRAALDGAYQVFERYKDSYGFARRSGISHALRQLTRDDWARMDAGFDMGVQLYSDNKNELFRHFLPRWLEWLSEESEPFPPFWLLWDLGSHLKYAQWLQWPTEEVQALRAVFEAWTRELLSQRDGKIPLHFLIDVEDDLSRYFDVWLDARPYEVARWLWTVDWAKNENVRVWASAPQVEAKLENAFFAHPDGADAALLSRSIEFVRSLRAL